jgi:hypothetical protein
LRRGGDVVFHEAVASLATKLAFLERSGAGGAGHSDHSLLDHLLGTRALLEQWEARAALCDAGLFHSVYGTHAYHRTIMGPEARAQLRELIGAEAEEIAYQFGIMDMHRFWDNADPGAEPGIFERGSEAWTALSWARVGDLATLALANHLEQQPRVPGVPLLPAPKWQLEKLVAPPAWSALERMLP